MGNSLLAVRDIDHKYIVVDTDHQKCENGRIRNTEFRDQNAGAVLIGKQRYFSCDNKNSAFFHVYVTARGVN